jgi:hypothetical protein
MIPESVAESRVRYRRERIGPHYSGVAHFLFTSGACLAIIVWAATGLKRPSVLEWLTVPLTFLFANFVEYWGHRRQMHHPRWPFEFVYQRHTVQHHHFFTHEAMSYESARDLKMVLFPPVLLFFFFGLVALPVGALLWLLSTGNVARLFVATAIGYYLTYEWLHFTYHLDPKTLVGRLGPVRALRRHHARHHDLALMSRYNFNITFPICDWLFGTSAPD